MEPTLDAHLITDRGLARERNEDRCGAFTPDDPAARAERGRMFVVADGMGGHSSGDVAAELAVETLPRTYYQAEWRSPEENLRAAFITANGVITQEGMAQTERQGMGSTAVVAVVLSGRAVVAHLGDCRAYHLRDGIATRLTSDHSWVGERIAAGRISEDEARSHPYRNVVTRALGAEDDAEPSVRETPFELGDALLLCSDGLWGVVDDQELAVAVRDLPDSRTAARSLVDLALERGGPDNISVAVVRLIEPTAAQPDAPVTPDK